MTRVSSICCTLALTVACAPTVRLVDAPKPAARARVPSVARTPPPARTAPATPSAAPSVTAPRADTAEPEPLEVELGKVHDDERPLTVARREADFGCAHATDATLSPPLRLLEVKESVHLWASTGPVFPSSLQTRRALLSVTTTGPSPQLLACGAAIALDLAPGRYWIRGQTRTTSAGSTNPQAPSSWLYTVFIAPPDGSAPAPTYFVVSGRPGALSIVQSGPVKPAHCL